MSRPVAGPSLLPLQTAYAQTEPFRPFQPGAANHASCASSTLAIESFPSTTGRPFDITAALGGTNTAWWGLAGGLSGALAKTFTAPMTRLTILCQVKDVGVLSALRQVTKQEGLKSLWKGNLITITHRIPYSAINFATYEVAKEQYRRLHVSDMTRRILSGATAGFMACIVAYPLDLLRTRTAVEIGSQKYRRLIPALRSVLAEEGMRGMYKGLPATLLQVVPSLAINFTTYDSLRASLVQPGEHPTPLTSIMCASGAGIITSTIVFPLDVVRRRMQVQGQGTRAAPSYSSVWRGVYQAGGLRAFYKGILPEYAKVAPGNVAAFLTFEALTHALGLTRAS